MPLIMAPPPRDRGIDDVVGGFHTFIAMLSPFGGVPVQGGNENSVAAPAGHRL
jgi:hypothetical protein